MIRKCFVSFQINSSLSKIRFNEFPPPTVDISGLPLQLWEAILANIDAKCLLYSLCHGGTYNVRAFSSMMGETFFSELTMYDKRGHGTITAEEFGQLLKDCKQDLIQTGTVCYIKLHM